MFGYNQFMKIKKIALAILFLALSAISIGAVTMNQTTETVNPGKQVKDTWTDENTFVTLHTKYGKTIIQLYPETAPIHVKNFLSLIDKGFYNGLKFHRVIKGFVAQGGDPLGNGTGGPGYHIKAEFNKRPHKEGTLSMARANDPDSAGSQFYICLAAQPHLDGNYSVFGDVIAGMNAIHEVKQGDTIDRIEISDNEGNPIWVNKLFFSEFEKIAK